MHQASNLNEKLLLVVVKTSNLDGKLLLVVFRISENTRDKSTRISVFTEYL